jgi:hypothetical protein
MTSYDAIIMTYKEFLMELSKTIPEQASLKAELESVDERESKEVVQTFIKQIPDSSKVVNRDSSFFTNPTEGSFPHVHNLDKYYDELSENTKDAIWQYLNTMYVLSTTINNIPAELLGAIENVAQKCAGDMQNTGEMPDMANLFAGMQNMLGGMMNNKSLK